MAVTNVIEHKRTFGKKLVQQDQELVPSYWSKRYFQIIVDDPATPRSEIFAVLPVLFEPDPEDDGLICKNIDPQQSDDDASYEYMVTVDYDDQYNGSEEESEDEVTNPLDRPVQVSLDFSEYDEIVVRDVDGTLVRNSAKDAFDPPLTRKGGALRFSMTKNYESLNLPFLRTYKNCINSDTWNGFSAGEVRIAAITGNKQIENMRVGETTVKVTFWQITFSFEVAETGYGRDGTWKAYVLDAGYQYWSDATGGWDVYPITQRDGTQVSTPAMLNGSGGLGNPNSPQFLPFNIYRPLPFAALGLL